MTTRLICCSTLFQLISVSAMRAAGAFGSDRCVLLLTNTSTAPELVADVDAGDGVAEALLPHFDAVVHLDEWIAPIHPREWRVAPANGPMLERLFRSVFELGDGPLELVLESLPNAPGGALAEVFPSARISMHSDGLMSYGPLRRALPRHVAERIEAIYYVDLVPGLRPVRLEEYQPRHVSVPAESLREVFAELASHTLDRLPDPSLLRDRTSAALLLGQYLTAIDILSGEEEVALHQAMIDAAVEVGCTDIVFKPHPQAPPAALGPLQKYAETVGAKLSVVREAVSAEALFELMHPAVVISCFSTALTTADAVYGLPVIAVGTDTVVSRLTPYQNSNRVPLAIIDAVYAQGILPPAQAEPHTPTEDLQAMLETLAYTLQPQFYDNHRELAEEFLTAADTPLLAYFTRGRLRRLGLPGTPPGSAPQRVVQALKRPVKAVIPPAARRKLRRVLRG